VEFPPLPPLNGCRNQAESGKEIETAQMPASRNHKAGLKKAMSKKKTEGPRRYRVLTRHMHSVALQDPVSFAIKVGEYPCRVFFRPSQTDPSLQRALGGTLFQLEFEAAESDLLRAASLGSRLTEDILAGLALVTGAPFGGVAFVHLVDITLNTTTPFVFLLAPSYLHTDRSINESDIAHLQAMLAHWDHLPKGARLRRAAGLYRRAIQDDDDVSSFQEAYMGLEALEPALAEQIGVTSGCEETTGNCEKCGAEFVRRRTVLNGVRAYIRGDKHPNTALTAQREKEWKQINDLRHNLFHSLVDFEKLRSQSRTMVAAAAHYLHDAVCCLSHAHNLESPTYRLPKGAKQLVLRGAVEPGIQDTLEECRPILTLKELGWDPHPKHGFVPRANIVHDRGNADIGGNFFWVTAPLDVATESDLRPAEFEA